MTSPRTPRQWNAGDTMPEDRPDVVDERGVQWAWDCEEEAYVAYGRNEVCSWGKLLRLFGRLSEVLPETPEPPQAPTDRDLLHQNVRFAIADPGHFLPRKADEPVSHWSARAVMDVLGMLDMLGAPGEGYTVLASQSVPAVPVSSTGGKETGEAAEGGTEALRLPAEVQHRIDEIAVGVKAMAKVVHALAVVVATSNRPDMAGWLAEVAIAINAGRDWPVLAPLPDSETEWGSRVNAVRKACAAEIDRAVTPEATQFPTRVIALLADPGAVHEVEVDDEGNAGDCIDDCVGCTAERGEVS